jgi:tetratricopeptide (TPR) repeat protein
MKALLHYIKIHSVFLILFFHYNTFAQQHKIDSLKHLLETNVKEDTNKVQVLYRLCFILREENPVEALKYGNSALKLATDLNYLKGIASSYNNLGAVYDKVDKKKEAIEYFYKAYQIKRQINDIKGLASTLGNLGVIYKREEDYTKAIEFYNLAYKYALQSKNTDASTGLLINLGKLYKEMGKNDSALHYLTAAKLASKDNLKNLIEIYSSLSNLYSESKTPELAILFADTGLVYQNKLSVKNYFSFFYLHKATAYENMNKMDSASKYYLSYKVNLKDTSDNEKLMQLYFRLSKFNYTLYKQTKNTENLEKAYLYEKLYETAYRKVHNIQKSKLLSNISRQIEVEKLESVILNTKKEKEISDLKSSQQKLVIYFSIFIIIAVSLLSIVTYKRYKVKKQLSVTLEDKNKIITIKNEEILSSISYAKRLQEAILPRLEFINKNVPNSFVIYKPKDIVAGDFYWAEKVGDLFYIAAADSTGHGVPGAMVSVVCSNALNRAVKEFGIIETGRILDKTRELVLETFEKSESEVKDGMDISLLCINLKNKQVTWSGSNNALWYVEDQVVKEIKPDKQPIGKSDNPKPFTTHAVDFKSGTLVYLLTDGLADQFGGIKGKKLKSKQLSEFLLQNCQLEMAQQAIAIEHYFNSWKGNLEQVDDVCLIGIKL